MSAAAGPLSPNAAGGTGVGGKQENVKVAIRVRPFNRREKDLGAKEIVEIGPEGKSITISDPNASAQSSGPAAGAGASAANKDGEAGKKTFFFDHVYGSDSAQADVYTQIAKPIVDQSLKGYNGTIFAYGQVSFVLNTRSHFLRLHKLGPASLSRQTCQFVSCVRHSCRRAAARRFR